MTAGSATRAGVDLRRLPLRHLVVAAVLPLLLLALLGATLLVRGTGATPTAIGSLAPEFSLADLDGNPIHRPTCAGVP
jgi:hypothetical protein